MGSLNEKAIIIALAIIMFFIILEKAPDLGALITLLGVVGGGLYLFNDKNKFQGR